LHCAKAPRNAKENAMAKRVLLAAAILTGCAVEAEIGPADQADTIEVEEAFPGRSGAIGSATVDTAAGARDVEFEIIDGVAIYQGDIELGPVNEAGRLGEAPRFSTGRSETKYRWPDGIVPYEGLGDFSEEQQAEIQSAIDHWNGSTPYWFRERNGEADYVRFITGDGCSSRVGRRGGEQTIKLGSGCNRGAAIHEIGHAIGLWHEQSRADRDSFIDIHWENVQEGKEHNFRTYIEDGDDGRDLFDYDFGSVMHYSGGAFTSTGDATITRDDGQALVAQRGGLSPTDVAGAVRELSHTDGMATFLIVNVNSGKCLDVAGGSRDADVSVHQWECHGLSNQRWYFHNVAWANRPLIVNEWSGHCLDVESDTDGTRLKQFPCHGFDNQQFNLELIGGITFLVKPQHTGKCVEVDSWSFDDGAKVQQWGCHGDTNQRWAFVQ
jgi:hypothetical protein